MTLQWNFDRDVWLTSDITDEEFKSLGKVGLAPQYYDNSNKGDAYTYYSHIGLGDIINHFFAERLELHIKYPCWR